MSEEMKMCKRCGRTLPITSFMKNKKRASGYGHPCKDCNNEIARIWRKTHPGLWARWAHKVGKHKPMSESKNSAPYLGVYVAESLLFKYFDNPQRAPPNNIGYDFICKNGFKIDVKSACFGTRGGNRWSFSTRKNKIADYFVFVGFDNRENLNPLHVWIVPGNIVSNTGSIDMKNTEQGLTKWSQYEKPIDKLQNVCNLMKEKGVV